jgi:hypothetical protein
MNPNKAKLNPILHNLKNAVSGEDKRSDHADFALSSELKERKWSGLRLNSLTDTYEFWIIGEVRKTLAASEVRKDYLSLERAHIELFGLHVGRKQ